MKKICLISTLLACSLAVSAVTVLNVNDIFDAVNQEQSGSYECPWTFVSGSLNAKGTCIVAKYGDETMFQACNMYGNYKNEEQIVKAIKQGKCKFVPGDKWPY